MTPIDAGAKWTSRSPLSVERCAMMWFASHRRAPLICLSCLLAWAAMVRAQLVPVLPATAPSTRPTTAAAATRPAPPAGDYLGTLKAGAVALRLGLKLEPAGNGFK